MAEFLNRQMQPAEVLAIELRQYEGRRGRAGWAKLKCILACIGSALLTAKSVGMAARAAAAPTCAEVERRLSEAINVSGDLLPIPEFAPDPVSSGRTMRSTPFVKA